MPTDMTSALPEVLEKLEPCPFCGREATVENPEEGCYAIGCDDCCFSVMAGNVGIGWYATRAAAITAWNKRPALLRDAGDAKNAERYRKLQAWYLSGAKMREIDPFGHIRPTTPEIIDSALDAMHAPGGATTD